MSDRPHPPSEMGSKPAAEPLSHDGRISPILFSNESTGGCQFPSELYLWAPAFSTRSMALDGVGWMWSGLVETAVGRRIDRMLQNRRRHPRPPSGICSARELVSASYLVRGRQARLNSVPCRSMACMMMARRRASATRALRIFERPAMASAQSFNFSWPLKRVSKTLAAS